MIKLVEHVWLKDFCCALMPDRLNETLLVPEARMLVRLT